MAYSLEGCTRTLKWAECSHWTTIDYILHEQAAHSRAESLSGSGKSTKNKKEDTKKVLELMNANWRFRLEEDNQSDPNDVRGSDYLGQRKQKQL